MNLKYRAWDNAQKEWLLGYDYLGGFSLFGESVLFGEWSTCLDKYTFERDGHKGDDLIVMSFTGLKDKNGREIYEGDILGSGDNYPSVVTWGDYPEGPGFFLDERGYEYGSRKHTMFAYTTSFEVIGNIYENPELLEGSKRVERTETYSNGTGVVAKRIFYSDGTVDTIEKKIPLG